MPLKGFGLACAIVVLSSPIAGAQVNFDELFQTIALDEEPSSGTSASGPATATDQDQWETLPQLPDGQLSDYGRFETAGPEQTADQLVGAGTARPVPSRALRPTDRHVDFDAIFRDCATEAAPSGEAPAEEVYAENGSAADVPPALTRLSPPPRRPSRLPATTHTPQDVHDTHTVQAPPATAPAGPPSLSSAPSVPCASGGSCAPAAAAHCAKCVTHLRATPCLEVPNLPPPASLESYYRTPACYRDLWGGYHQERLHACQCHHRHLHGHCKCLDPAPHPGHPPAGAVRASRPSAPESAQRSQAPLR